MNHGVDRYIPVNPPAAYILIKGKFVKKHKSELHHLIKQLTERAKSEHSPQHVIAIKEKPKQLLLATDSTHLARMIGEALLCAFHGEVKYSFSMPDRRLCMQWRRD